MTRRRTHGMSRTPVYRVWEGMLKRCRSPKDISYPRYGARGIKVCKRWHDFAAFYADMGPRPSPKHSIERRSNDGDYEPSNCFWATKTEQQRNMRSNRLVTHDGRTQCVAAWADESPVSAAVLSSRLFKGWSFADALRLPKGVRRRSKAKLANPCVAAD